MAGKQLANEQLANEQLANEQLANEQLANEQLANIYVKKSGISGFGLFARQDIAANDIIWSDDNYGNSKDNVIVSFKEMSELARDNLVNFLKNMYQIDDDKFIGTFERNNKDLSLFINHSCSPNSWFSSEFTIRAMCNIQKNEEITYDYSTTDSHPQLLEFMDLLPYYKQCMCGANNCRKVLSPNDWKSDELQNRGRFIPYLKSKILRLE